MSTYTTNRQGNGNLTLTAEQNSEENEVNLLLKRISLDLPKLSLGLQRIARYVDIALEKIQHIANMCDIQPSAVIRFAKHFGFNGFSDMQRIFRDGMTAHISYQRNYKTRIRDLIDYSEKALSTREIAESYLEGSIAEMQTLKDQLQHNDDLQEAVRLLVDAPNFWVVGTNRSFPVASYLVYLLQHTEKPVHLVPGLGAMFSADLRALHSNDVMIAISFAPYGKETLNIVETARSKAVKIIAITDSILSPLNSLADVCLQVPESSVFGFRSLTNNMLIAQSMFVALAYQLEMQQSRK
jgi:DNA-binding MurR/RpiR family transcriptional regulator